jgi:serine/threonine protein kinase
LVGKRLGNDFELVRMISEDNYGKTFIAAGVESGIKTSSEYFVKIINMDSIQAQPEIKSIIEYHINLMSKLTHSNICGLLTHMVSRNNEYLIYRYIKPGSLEEVLKRSTFFPEVKAYRYLRELLIGYTALMRADIVHRNLKPSSILFDNDNAIIGGFRYAQLLADPPQMMGLSDVSPPELLLGEYTKQDSRVDIWGFGLVFYYMLFGRLPWQVSNSRELRQVFETSIGDNLDLPATNTSVSEKTKKLLKSMLAFPLNRRISWHELYSSLSIADDLLGLPHNEPPQANEPRPSYERNNNDLIKLLPEPNPLLEMEVIQPPPPQPHQAPLLAPAPNKPQSFVVPQPQAAPQSFVEPQPQAAPQSFVEPQPQVALLSNHPWGLLVARCQQSLSIHKAIKLEKPSKLCQKLIGETVSPSLRFMAIVAQINRSETSRFNEIAAFPVSLLEETLALIASLSRKYESQYQSALNGFDDCFVSFQDGAIVSDLMKLVQRAIAEAKQSMSCVEPTLRQARAPVSVNLAYEIDSEVPRLNRPELAAAFNSMNGSIKSLQETRREIEQINYPLF